MGESGVEKHRTEREKANLFASTKKMRIAFNFQTLKSMFIFFVAKVFRREGFLFSSQSGEKISSKKIYKKVLLLS